MIEIYFQLLGMVYIILIRKNAIERVLGCVPSNRSPQKAAESAVDKIRLRATAKTSTFDPTSCGDTSLSRSSLSQQPHFFPGISSGVD